MEEEALRKTLQVQGGALLCCVPVRSIVEEGGSVGPLDQGQAIEGDGPAEGEGF
jgi:hypothetical protein